LKKPLYFALSLALLAAVYVSQGAAMSIFFGGEKTEVVLFSPLEGKLTYNGKPAAGAKLRLWIAWKDQEGETESFTADEHGQFSIPKRTTVYRKTPLAQLSVGQTITVEYSGNEYLIWKAGKSSPELYGELGGRPQNVHCELTKQEMDVHLEHSLLETLCEWTKID
jgi:hypothetical protein